MSAEARLEWARPEDEVWADRLRLRLALVHGGEGDLAEEVLAEVHQACTESGRTAEELFGTADAYAAEVAEDRIPVEVRAEADLDGAVPGMKWQGLAYAVGGTGIMLCLLVLLQDGWRAAAGPGELVLLVAVVVGMGAAVWGLLERHAGNLRRGWVLWTGTAAVVVAGSWIGVTLRDRPSVGGVPVLWLLAACVTLVAVAHRLPDHVVPARDWRSDPADAWFDRLGAVLRGRYYLPRADVAAQVAEARTYWRETGAAHPYDEFGAPSVYALRLVQGSTRPHRGRRRVRAWIQTGVAVLAVAVLVGTVVEGGSTSDFAWRIGAVLLFSGLAVHRWRTVDGPPV